MLARYRTLTDKIGKFGQFRSSIGDGLTSTERIRPDDVVGARLDCSIQWPHGGSRRHTEKREAEQQRSANVNECTFVSFAFLFIRFHVVLALLGCI